MQKKEYTSCTTGMLDVSNKSCPLFYGMIKAFDIHWNKVPDDETWFISKFKPTVINMFNCGDIREKFHDANHFPIDKDKVGNKYTLN